MSNRNIHTTEEESHSVCSSSKRLSSRCSRISLSVSGREESLVVEEHLTFSGSDPKPESCRLCSLIMSCMVEH